ncbi:MAG: non-homologous end-joining DNA ligase [bacterium]
MLAKACPEPFDSEDHLFEPKWDGTRCIAFLSRGQVRLQNRRLLDITYRYPEFKELPAVFNAKDVILDGEIVVFVHGKPSFEKLQKREHLQRKPQIEILSRQLPARFIGFDILYLDGQDLTGYPLRERKQVQSRIVSQNVPGIFYETPYIFREGRKFFEGIVNQGLEGAMAKSLRGKYLMGRRSGNWLKIKNKKTQECVICGYTESASRPFGSLLLAVYDGETIIYVGHVGTGFSGENLKHLHDRFGYLETDRCPFSKRPNLSEKIHWLSPQLVCQVEYLTMTESGRLRAPSFRGLRTDKVPKECVMEGR